MGDRPKITSTEAQLFVADIQASCDFYTSKLGFEVAFVYGDPPFYGQVTRDRASINLRVVGEPVFARRYPRARRVAFGFADTFERGCA